MKIYYSYCCGKVVEKDVDTKMYYCSRCKKPLTVYGNPTLKEDKEELKEKQKKIRKDNGICGNTVKLLENGDIYLINKWYKKVDLDFVGSSTEEGWVLLDKKGQYVTAICVDYKSNAVYIEQDAFVERLKKAKLWAIRLSSFKFEGYNLSSLEELKSNPKKLKRILMSMGWDFDKNGYVK